MNFEKMSMPSPENKPEEEKLKTSQEIAMEKIDSEKAEDQSKNKEKESIEDIETQEKDKTNNLTPDQELINKAREDNDKYFFEKAKQHNAERGIIKKMLWRDKLSGIDMAQQEANNMEYLMKGSLFKDEKEMNFLLKQPEIKKAIENNDFDAITDAAFDLGKKEGNSFKYSSFDIEQEQLAKTVATGDMDKLKELVLKNISGKYEHFDLNDLARMPHEIVELPEVKEKLFTMISFDSIFSQPSLVAKNAEEIVSKGLLSKEEVDAFIHSEKYETKILKDVISKIDVDHPDKAKERMDSFVEAGLLSESIAREMFDSDMFLEACQKEVSSELWRGGMDSRRQIGIVKKGFNSLAEAGLLKKNVVAKVIRDFEEFVKKHPNMMVGV